MRLSSVLIGRKRGYSNLLLGSLKDSDSDGVPDFWDCAKFNPKRHGPAVPPALQQLRPQPLPQKAPTLATQKQPTPSQPSTPIIQPLTQVSITYGEFSVEKVESSITDLQGSLEGARKRLQEYNAKGRDTSDTERYIMEIEDKINNLKAVKDKAATGEYDVQSLINYAYDKAEGRTARAIARKEYESQPVKYDTSQFTKLGLKPIIDNQGNITGFEDSRLQQSYSVQNIPESRLKDLQQASLIKAPTSTSQLPATSVYTFSALDKKYSTIIKGGQFTGNENQYQEYLKDYSQAKEATTNPLFQIPKGQEFQFAVQKSQEKTELIKQIKASPEYTSQLSSYKAQGYTQKEAEKLADFSFQLQQTPTKKETTQYLREYAPSERTGVSAFVFGKEGVAPEGGLQKYSWGTGRVLQRGSSLVFEGIPGFINIPFKAVGAGEPQPLSVIYKPLSLMPIRVIPTAQLEMSNFFRSQLKNLSPTQPKKTISTTADTIDNTSITSMPKSKVSPYLNLITGKQYELTRFNVTPGQVIFTAGLVGISGGTNIVSSVANFGFSAAALSGTTGRVIGGVQKATEIGGIGYVPLYAYEFAKEQPVQFGMDVLITGLSAYGGYNYLTKPTITTESVGLGKYKNIMGYEDVKGVKQVQAGRRTIVSQRYRDWLGMQPIYKGVPYETRVSQVIGLGTDFSIPAETSYQKAFNLLTREGYADIQARNILRFYKPILKPDVAASLSVSEATKIGQDNLGRDLFYVEGRLTTRKINQFTKKLGTGTTTEIQGYATAEELEQGGIKVTGKSLAGTQKIRIYADKITGKQVLTTTDTDAYFYPTEEESILKGTARTEAKDFGTFKARISKAGTTGEIIKEKLPREYEGLSNIKTKILGTEEGIKKFGNLIFEGERTKSVSLIRTDLYPERIRVRAKTPYTRRISTIYPSQKSLSVQAGSVFERKPLNIQEESFVSGLTKQLKKVSAGKKASVVKAAFEQQAGTIAQVIEQPKITKSITPPTAKLTSSLTPSAYTGSIYGIPASIRELAEEVPKNKLRGFGVYQVGISDIDFNKGSEINVPSLNNVFMLGTGVGIESSLLPSDIEKIRDREVVSGKEKRIGIELPSVFAFGSELPKGSSGLMPKQEQRQQPVQRQFPQQRITQITKQPGVPIIVPPTPVPFTFPGEVPPKPEPPTRPIDLERKKKERLNEQPYNAYVYVDATKGSKARYEQINEQPLTLKSAVNAVARVVDKTISARGKVEKAKPIMQEGKKVLPKAVDTKDNYFEINKFKFRNYRTKKKLPLPTGVIIERQAYRLDSRGEVKKIQKERRRTPFGF